MSEFRNEPFLPDEPHVGWLLYDALPGTRCEALLAQLEQRGFDPTGELYPHDYRNNDRLVFDDDELAASLFELLGARLPAELTIDGAQWTLAGLNRRFRACRYHDGQSFCIHRDGPHVPSDELRSHLTLQLYLDDVAPDAGGHTRFYADAAGSQQVAAIAPRRGHAIVFDHRAWHDGEPVRIGDKHVLRTDVMYRRTTTVAPRRDMIGCHRGYAWRVVACRDGSLASCGRDGTVRRWSRTPRVFTLDAGSVTALVEDGRGRLWAGTRAGTIAVETGDAFTRVADDVGAVLAGAVLPGDAGVVFATSRGTLVAFNSDGSPRPAIRAHTGWAWAIAADGERVVSCGEDGRVVQLDASGSVRVLAELATGVRALAVLGRELLVGDTRGWLYRLRADGGVVASWRAHTAAITTIAVTDDGWLTGGEDACVHRWRGGQVVSTATAPDFVTSIAVDARGGVACAGYDGAIWLV